MMDRLGQKLSRIVAVCVVSGCLSCCVYGDETINAQTITAKTIDVSASDLGLQFDSGGYLEVTNSTNAVNFTGTGIGKTFTITNGSSVDPDSTDTNKRHWLISATNNTGDQSNPCNASAIDLTGICGEAGKPFTISLPTTDKTYSFSATAQPENSAGVTCASVIGVPQAPSDEIRYITVDTNGGQAKLNFSATATGGTVHSGAAVFGTGHANNSGDLTNWTIEDIGADSVLSATATGSTDAYSTIFGAGRANGAVDFNAWTIGNIGENSKLTSQSEYSTIFGAGYAYLNSTSGKLNFANWNIGNIGAGASLDSKSTVSGGASSIVGPAYAKSTAAAAESLDFSGLGHGGAEAGATMTSEATGGYSTVFGAGYADGSVGVKNWTIGTIGGAAEGAAATTLSSKGKYSSVFGAGYAKLDKEGATLDFSGWKIGNLDASGNPVTGVGNNVTITSEGRFATIFGAGCTNLASGTKITCVNWNIGAIGENAAFTSTATHNIFDSSSSSRSNIIGAGYGMSSSFDNWVIGDIGANAQFTSISTSCAEYNTNEDADSSSSSRSNIIGAGHGTNSSFDNWVIGDIGANAQFSSFASSMSVSGHTSSSASGIIGAGAVNDAKNTTGVLFSGWNIGNIGENAQFVSTSISNTSTESSEDSEKYSYARSSVIGAGSINDHYVFSGWNIGNIGPNAVFTSTAQSTNENCQSSSSSASGIIGAGAANGCTDGVSKLDGWSIGNIGEGATFTSSSCSVDSFSAASIFGAGCSYSYGSDFRKWTIGDIGNEVVFTSNASSNSKNSYSSIFGAAYAASGATVQNWTAEFRGNAVVASTAYASDSTNCHISTFGGTINGGSAESDGMRFYFNGKQKPKEQIGDPVVTIGALKLADAWTVAEGTATATIAGGEDSQNGARAFGIGPNFQINVGRERTLADTKQGNGTLETLDSITNGGKSSSAVTMNILGEIRAATGNSSGVQTGSIMRIDGGSAVNCFRPVQDLSKIEIINGTMNLMDKTNTSELNDALQHLQANISYSTYNATSKETELYQNDGDKTIELCGATQARADRDGNVALNVADGGYPINGTLTIGSGQTLVFGVDLTQNEDGNLSMFKKTNGVLYVPNTGQKFVLDGGMLAIDDVSTNGEPSYVEPHTSFYVVRADCNVDITHGEGFLNVGSSGYVVEQNPYFVEGCDETEHVELYRITQSDGSSSIVSTDNPEYTYWNGLHAYWMNYEDEQLAGIVIGAGCEEFVGAGGRPPATKEPTDYAKDFASEELASIDAEIMNDIQRHIVFAEMCSYKQDPFIMLIGGHGHQDEILGYGYDYDKYGIVIGHDFIKELSNGGNLKFGGAIGYCHANIYFFGNATSRSKHAGKDMYNVGIFGMYKNDNSKHMHTRFHVFGGFAYVENEMSRVDSNNAHFNTKFDSNDINVSAEWMKGMVRLCGLEVGPWAGVTYNRIHQKSYHENGGQNAASLDAVDFDMLDTILGLHAEKIFLHKENDKKYLHLILRAGWKCQPIRSHSHCLARLDDAGIAPFVPVFGYTDKHSGILYGGLKNKISDNISISGGIGSAISHDHWNISGHIALNYYY